MTSSIDNIIKIRRRHASFMPLRKRAASSRALSRLLPAVFDTELTNCRPEAHPPNSDEVCSIILLISITLHLVRLLAGIAECSHMALRFLNLSKSVILLFSQICVLYHTFCYLANYVHHATLSGNRCTISITLILLGSIAWARCFSKDVAGLGTWQSVSEAKREAYVPLGAPQLDASRSEKSICAQFYRTREKSAGRARGPPAHNCSSVLSADHGASRYVAVCGEQ